MKSSERELSISELATFTEVNCLLKRNVEPESMACLSCIIRFKKKIDFIDM
jgi:hypothetical protein